MKILVTGGAGYIGSHVCKALARNGFKPVVYDNLSRGNRWAVKWGPLEEGDILDEVRLREVFAFHQPGAIMHFAAYAYIGESVEKPHLYYQNNIVGSTTLLRTTARWRVPVVFSSTCATYGIPERIPITENHPQRPINPYGYSKLAVENMLKDMEGEHQSRSVILRYFNAAGADPEGEIGEAHDPEPHLIPRILAAAQNDSVVRVYGDNYDTPDGTCVRDYVHVTDLAEAHVLALKTLQNNSNPKSLNLGTGKGFSVREVIQTARLVTGRTIAVREGPRRPGDPPQLVADATRAKNELGWKPRYGDLKQVIATAWNWNARELTQRPQNAI